MSTPTEATPKTDWTAYAPLDAGPLHQLRAASADLVEGLRRHRAWRYLAVEQVKNSYRRTVLGPWWLTAQMAVYVTGMAFVFSQLLGSKINTFLPYVALGFLGYAMLSGLVRSGANVFVGQAGVIKSTRQPLTSLVLRAVMIELIQFSHNAAIVLVFFAVGLITPSVWLLLAPLALGVILLNGVLIGMWLGPTVARFRDVAPGIDSIQVRSGRAGVRGGEGGPDPGPQVTVTEHAAGQELERLQRRADHACRRNAADERQGASNIVLNW